MAKGYIVINETYCKGCALCIDACPKQVVEIDQQKINAKGYHPAALVDPQNECTGCALCAVVCPDVAISVYRYQKPRAYRPQPVAV